MSEPESVESWVPVPADPASLPAVAPKKGVETIPPLPVEDAIAAAMGSSPQLLQGTNTTTRQITPGFWTRVRSRTASIIKAFKGGYETYGDTKANEGVANPSTTPAKKLVLPGSRRSN